MPSPHATRTQLISRLAEIIEVDDPENEFDIECALYWHAANYHGGQGTKLYEVLSQSKYKPGASERAPESGSLAEYLESYLAGELTDLGDEDEPDGAPDEHYRRPS